MELKEELLNRRREGLAVAMQLQRERGEHCLKVIVSLYTSSHYRGRTLHTCVSVCCFVARTFIVCFCAATKATRLCRVVQAAEGGRYPATAAP